MRSCCTLMRRAPSNAFNVTRWPGTNGRTRPSTWITRLGMVTRSPDTTNASWRYSFRAPLAAVGLVAAAGPVGEVLGLGFVAADAAAAGATATAIAAPAQANVRTSPLDMRRKVNQARRFSVQGRGRDAAAPWAQLPQRRAGTRADSGNVITPITTSEP